MYVLAFQQHRDSNFVVVEAAMRPVTIHSAEKPALAVRTAPALIGFSSVIGQIVLMRELMIVFNGNESSLGIMLATWLFWTAAGSSLSSRFARCKSNARLTVAVLECLVAVTLIPTMWALRASKSIFQTVPGQLVGPVPMVLASLATLSLFCVFSGALFVAAARLIQNEYGVSSRLAAGSTYMLEAVGSGLGGMVASMVLLRFCESFQIAAIVAVLNLAMAAFLLFRKQVAVLAVTAALCVGLLLAWLAPWLDRSSRARLWQGFQLVASHDSIYGNLTVTATGNIRSIYDNGVILLNAPDQNAAEEAVHYALLEHAAPMRVLLIGGGVNGSIAQALKHPTVERIDYVELDPALIDLVRNFFPAESTTLDSDPRVHIHYADGRSYLRTTNDTFDVIILDVPDPLTAQLNRFYTAEFFQSARNHLAPGGLLALELRSSEETISPGLAEFLRCIHHTLRQVFPYVAILPGETIHFFAATRPDVLTEDPKTLITRLLARDLKTQYVREYFIPFRMMPDRMEQIHEQLQPLASTPVNRDFAPIAYYFDLALWNAQFNAGNSRWFEAAVHIDFPVALAAAIAVSILVVVFPALVPVRARCAQHASACCMAATGFTLITLEIVLLLAFQSIYGYVYHQLAILIGFFMAGIALGSWLGLRRIRLSNRTSNCNLAVTQFLLAFSVVALLFVVSLLGNVSGVIPTWLTAQCGFPALAALCGMLGGYQFSIAIEIYLGDSAVDSSPGALYAIDLLGGCTGALLVSTYLIPIFGFWRTAWLCAAINLAPALLATWVNLEAKRSGAY